MRDVSVPYAPLGSAVQMMDAIRETLKAQRERLGISLTELDARMARVAGANSYNGYASQLESGKIAFPGMNTVIRWVLALDLDLSITFSARNDDPPVGIASTNQTMTRVPAQRKGSTALHLQTAQRSLTRS